MVRIGFAVLLGLGLALPVGVVSAQDYTLFMEDAEAVSGGDCRLEVLGTWADDVTGFSLSLSFTPSPPITGLDFSIEGTLTGELDPDFFIVNIDPALGQAIVGLLFETTHPLEGVSLPPVSFPLAVGAFVGTVPAGTPPQAVLFDFLDGLGQPPVDNRFVVSTVTSVPPTLLNGGTLSIVDPPPPPPQFLRGDANNDGNIDIGDILFHLNATFQSGPRPPCEDAGDANDDGLSDITDAVYLICYIFAGGNTPPEPFPGYGIDPSDEEAEDFLGCEAGI